MFKVTDGKDLRPGRIITEPGEKYSLAHRLWQGCPTVARTEGGRLWAGWYSGGPFEPHPDNYNLLVKSDDDGASWSEPVLIIDSVPEAGYRALDIQLWYDCFRRLWVFWTQTVNGNDDTVWCVTCDAPDAEKPEFTAPRLLTPGFLRCQPTVLPDGRWLLCGYVRRSDRYCYSVSSDCGDSWTLMSGPRKIPTIFDETMVAVRRDGALWMLARTKPDVGYLAQTFSFDNGKTWMPAGLSTIKSPSSRFFIRRLSSGRLLLINHLGFNGRSHMTALLSEDDGESWKYSLLLDERENVSYPDAIEGGDGTLYIVYDRSRTGDAEILMAKLTEADIMAGSPERCADRLKLTISRPPKRSDN